MGRADCRDSRRGEGVGLGDVVGFWIYFEGEVSRIYWPKQWWVKVLSFTEWGLVCGAT